MDNAMVAAISGVINYLAEEKQPEGTAFKKRDDIPSGSRISPWALYGRQTIMRMRGMVQRRLPGSKRSIG